MPTGELADVVSEAAEPDKLATARSPHEDGSSPSVEVRFLGGERGNALFARRSFEAGEVVWEETPVSALQHFYSELVTPSCRCCFRAFKNLKESLDGALKMHGKSLDRDFPEAVGIAEEIDAEILTSTESCEKTEGAPAVSGKGSSGPIQCPHGCKGWFCGAECLELACSGTSHSILCVELPEAKKQLVQEYKKYCKVKQESLWMGLLVYGEILSCVRHGMDLETAMVRFNFLSGSPQWQDMVEFETSDAYDLDRIEYYRDLRNQLLCESLSMVTDILSHYLVDCSPLFEPDYWATLIGHFARVSMSLIVTHPLTPRVQGVLEGRPRSEEALAPLRKAFAVSMKVRNGLREHDCELTTFPFYESGYPDSEDSEDEDEWALPKVEGFCLLRLIAFTNHSCVPNVRVDFPYGDWTAVAQALRPLKAGDEVLMSYVDEDKGYEFRRKRLLFDYGFECGCEKCLAERSSATPEASGTASGLRK